MSRQARVSLFLSIGVALLAVAVLVAIAARPAEDQWWTDGGAIRAPEAGAPIREILWLPAELLKGADFGSSDEYEPRYSADGTMVVFVRGRPGQNADLYSARWSPSGWSIAQPIESINTSNDELGPELSPDGVSLYFYSDRPGGLGGYDLWVSSATEGGWGPPNNLGPEVNSRWNEYGPAISPSGDRLYFSSNRPRPGEAIANAEGWSATIREERVRHDYDLFASELSAGTSREARPIEPLNTPADEGAPAVSPAGDFLYFASDRTGGLGGFDVYRTRLKAVGAFAEIENLGSSINSVSNDLDPALSSDGFRLTFSSDRERSPHDRAHAMSEQPAAYETGRYALWSSSSREVYRELQIGESRLPVLWQKVWPWLLLLLALTPLLLLYRLAREESWRRRFAGLSLLAQCVLLSLIIHAGVASVLTIWKVGVGIIESMHTGGGTRVVLTSGGLSGSVAGQLRASSTDGRAELPELGRFTVPVLVEPAVPILAHVNVPEIDVPIVNAITDRIRTPAERSDPRSAVVTLPAPTAESVPAIPLDLAPDLNQAEPHVDTPIATWKQGAAGAIELTKGARVDTELPMAPAIEKNGPIAAGITGAAERDSQQTHARGTALPTPPSAVQANLPPVADVQVSRTEPTSGTGFIVDGLRAPAPAAFGAVAAARVDVALNPMGPSNEIENDRTGIPSPEVARDPSMRSESARGAATHISSIAPTVPVQHDVPQPRFPSSPRNESLSAVEAGRPNIDTSTRGLAPAPVSILPSASERPSSTFINPRLQTHSDEQETGPAISGLGKVVAPSRDRPSAAAMPQLAQSGGTPSHIASESQSQIPVGIPVPIETFDQRAPEARGELVEKMGGSDQTERAVGLALDWFVRHQSPDGHWSAEHYDDACGRCNGAAEFKADAAMTGMVLLCYLGAGHTHTQEGPYREAVKNGLAWLVKRQADDGDLRRGETMYGQTAAAVALCEAFAMSRDPELAEPARKAVEFVLERAARQESSSSRDTSVLGWLVFTVESARRAGFAVPQTTFDAAGRWLDYVRKPGEPGRYAYTKGGRASAAMTAEAMFVQQLLGHARDEAMMQQSAGFVLGTPPKWQEGAPTYYWYYATLALFQHQGDEWKRWNEQLVRELLAHQEQQGPASGSWDPTDPWSRMGGRVYQTAVCTLSLEVYYRYKAK